MSCHNSACHAVDFWVVFAILVILKILMIGYCCWFKTIKNTKDESTQAGIELITTRINISTIHTESVPNHDVSNYNYNDPSTLPPPSYNEVIESNSDVPPTYLEAFQ